jgi:DNA polymerase-3 subunit gamma/tau
VIDAGHEPRRFAIDLLERFRDLIVLQAVPDAATRGVVDAPGDVLDRMRDQADRVGPATLARYAEVVHAGLGEMRGATSPRLLLEVVCARLLLPSASDTESALLQRIERIETRMDISIPADETTAGAAPVIPGKQYVRKAPPAVDTGPAAPTAVEPAPIKTEPVAAEPEPPQAKSQPPQPPETPQPPEPTPEPVATPAPEPEPVADAAPEAASAPAAAGPGEPSAAAVRSMWPTVQEKVRERSRTTAVMLAGAIVRTVEDGTLVLMHDSAPLAKRISEQRNADVIREALKDALGVNWRVRCEVGTGESAPVAPAESEPEPREDLRAEEDSMIAEVGRDDDAPRRDPEEAAMELLQTELGARRIDG